MFYRTSQPCWYHGSYYAANPRNPLVIEVPSSYRPLRFFTECDGPATAPRPADIPLSKYNEHKPTGDGPQDLGHEAVRVPETRDEQMTLGEIRESAKPRVPKK